MAETTLHALGRILNPRSVALVGASGRENSLGNWFLQAMINGGFPGALYPVNPKGGQIRGLPAVKRIEALPRGVDLGILCIPGEAVPEALERCGRHGMSGVMIAAGGFAEMGKEGEAMQRHMVDRARGLGLRLMGPNTIGFVNTRARLNASFSREMGGSKPGSIGVVSQSGSVCETLFFRCRERGFGFSHLIASGNEADLDLCDYMEYLLHDPPTRVIALYMEQMPRPARFVEIVRRGPAKPTVIFRTGRTPGGRAAASSHTGALCGEDAVLSGLIRQLGLVEVRSYQALLDALVAAAAGRFPAGNRLAVVTGPGAPGVAACDAAAEIGVRMDPLGEAAQSRLARVLPAIASCRNPVDLTGVAATSSGLVAAALDVVLAEDTVDGALVIFGALSTLEGLDGVLEVFRRRPKPLLAVTVASLTENVHTRAIIQRLGRAGIPSFFTPEQAVAAFKTLVTAGRAHGLPRGP